MKADTARIRQTENELESIRHMFRIRKNQLMEKRMILRRLMQTDRAVVCGYRLEEQMESLEQELARLDGLVNVLAQIRTTYERTEEQVLRGDRRKRIRVETADLPKIRVITGLNTIERREYPYVEQLPMPDTRFLRESWESQIRS